VTIPLVYERQSILNNENWHPTKSNPPCGMLTYPYQMGINVWNFPICREDFEIAECAPQTEATSVFKLLEDACLGFAKRSSFSQRKKLKTPIYSTMLWSKLQCSDFPTISVQSVTSNLLLFGVDVAHLWSRPKYHQDGHTRAIHSIVLPTIYCSLLPTIYCSLE